MIMYYVSIVIAILSTALYHVSQKLTPRGVNPPISLMLTNGQRLEYSAETLALFPQTFYRIQPVP